MKIKIDWETDGQKVKLPNELEIPEMLEEEIADYLSDHFGFLVNGITIMER